MDVKINGKALDLFNKWLSGEGLEYPKCEIVRRHYLVKWLEDLGTWDNAFYGEYMEGTSVTPLEEIIAKTLDSLILEINRNHAR